MAEHALSKAALDAALEATKTGELLYSEALTVRARALVSRATSASTHNAGGSATHWDTRAENERLHEVMGRMDCDRAVLAALLLHGL